jgi:hypothetical protein
MMGGGGKGLCPNETHPQTVIQSLLVYCRLQRREKSFVTNVKRERKHNR